MDNYIVEGSGEIRTVNLDVASSNELDLAIANQFVKTCTASQQFIIVNEDFSTFKLILTGGSLSATLFKNKDKAISLIWENGALADYNAAKVNRVYGCIEQMSHLEIEKALKYYRKQLISAFDNNAYNANVILSFAGLQADRVYGFPYVTTYVSNRSSVQYNKCVDGIHLFDDGYKQIADGIFSTITNII